MATPHTRELEQFADEVATLWRLMLVNAAALDRTVAILEQHLGVKHDDDPDQRPRLSLVVKQP